MYRIAVRAINPLPTHHLSALIFCTPITFIPPLLPLPIEFSHFLKLAQILLYRITYMFVYRDGLGE